MATETTENEKIFPKTPSFESIERADDEEFPEKDDIETTIDGEFTEEKRPANFIVSDETTEHLTGIAALLANVKTEKEASLIIKRLADQQYKGQFRVPCTMDKTVETIRWNGEPYPGEHYEYVQRTYGGGFYRFQLQYGGGFKEAWVETLDDLPTLSEKELLIKKEEATKEREQPRTVESSQPFVQSGPENKMDGMREFMRVFKEMKEFENAMSSKNEKEPEHQASEPPITKESIQMEIVRGINDDPEILKMAVRSIFGIKDAQEKPPGFFAQVGNAIGSAIVSNPRIIEKVVDTAATAVSVVAETGKSFFVPKPTRPEGGLDGIAPMENNTQQAGEPEMQPEAQGSAENEQSASEQSIELVIKPSIRI